jgi:two-component sensor histidine kinase
MANPIPLHPNLALNLGLAIVAASNTPLLLLDDELTVIAASTSFCLAFQIAPDSVQDFKLFELGRGEWDRPQLRSLLKTTARGFTQVEAYEMDLSRAGRETRRLVLSAQKLDYGDDQHVRIILAVADVTDARLADKVKDDLLREKALLVQEVQHRVANSLQIIASVLMQSARKMNSEESRFHIQAAHQRVMSVAAVQKRLSASGLGDVELRPYLKGLCESLSASMIPDHDQLLLDVTADDTVTSSETSISLGLIVTELVINALKHAFPGHRKGRITVAYQAHGPKWSLTVGDNGIGISNVSGGSKSGLGTSIVEALARQLDAEVDVTNAHPGTEVTVRHSRTPFLVGQQVGHTPV